MAKKRTFLKKQQIKAALGKNNGKAHETVAFSKNAIWK